MEMNTLPTLPRQRSQCEQPHTFPPSSRLTSTRSVIWPLWALVVAPIRRLLVQQRLMRSWDEIISSPVQVSRNSRSSSNRTDPESPAVFESNKLSGSAKKKTSIRLESTAYSRPTWHRPLALARGSTEEEQKMMLFNFIPRKHTKMLNVLRRLNPFAAVWLRSS